ncbi:MAG: sulfotransferase family 2 domain-containing protein [Pseudomonadota bacterium]
MALRLFGRRRNRGFWDPGESPTQPGRMDKPDLAGRRAFLAEHVLLHTHIPKTGGSSLSHGLAGIVGAVNTMDLRMNRRVDLDEMSDDDLAELLLLSGHFTYGVHQRFKRTPLYIAAVREPVARAVSEYRYIRTHPKQRHHKELQDLDFEAAWNLLKEARGASGENAQSRQITANRQKSAVAEKDLWQMAEYGYFLIIPQPKINTALQRLRGAFGVPWSRLSKHNVSEGNEVKVSTEMRSRILDANRSDMELFARVTEDFDLHLNRACDYIASSCLMPLEDSQI